MSTLLLNGCVGGGTATSTADAEKEINKVLQFSLSRQIMISLPINQLM
ncbi:MAG TPA: hypothetical protein GXZ55_00145 [Natronincola sp.]|nr:hypothetical protein [Natronincola sp.]